MNTFPSIKVLLRVLSKEQKLLTEMFEKRETLSYRFEHALAVVDYEEERIDYLVEYAVLKRNGVFLEIDDLFLEFFEQVLTGNEEINTATIDTNIQQVKENMLYYLNETNERKRYNYLKAVKLALRKIGNITVRNVINLSRTLTVTFKNEANLKVKKLKLEVLDGKQKNITEFIDQTYQLLDTEEETFFKMALDDELNQVIFRLKEQLNECKHNLIDIRKQIIEFLNQIVYQSMVVEKLRRIKYLKDQLTIRAETNLIEVLENTKDVVFESKPKYPLKLSLDYLQSADDAIYELIRKCAHRVKSKAKVRQPLAGTLTEEFLNVATETETRVNLEEIRNGFIASGKHLFEFVVSYPYDHPVSFDELVTLYCQLISLYDDEFDITDRYATMNDVEYALVFPR